MSTTLGSPATLRGRIRSGESGLTAAVKTWWKAYLDRRRERAAIAQLHAMSDRELRDIGLTRSEIDLAVRGELDRGPFARHY